MNNDYIIPNEDWDSQEKKETVRMKNADFTEATVSELTKTISEKVLNFRFLLQNATKRLLETKPTPKRL